MRWHILEEYAKTFFVQVNSLSSRSESRCIVKISILLFYLVVTCGFPQVNINFLISIFMILTSLNSVDHRRQSLQ